MQEVLIDQERKKSKSFARQKDGSQPIITTSNTNPKFISSSCPIQLNPSLVLGIWMISPSCEAYLGSRT